MALPPWYDASCTCTSVYYTVVAAVLYALTRDPVWTVIVFSGVCSTAFRLTRHMTPCSLSLACTPIVSVLYAFDVTAAVVAVAVLLRHHSHRPMAALAAFVMVLSWVLYAISDVSLSCRLHAAVHLFGCAYLTHVLVTRLREGRTRATPGRWTSCGR